MRVTRLLTLLLSAALLGLPGLVLGAGTATAAESLTTAITIEPVTGILGVPNVLQYGESFGLSGKYTTVNASGAQEDPRAGQTLTLQRLIQGSSTWQTLATYTDSYGSFYFDGLKAERNAIYRVSFAGGTQPSSDYNSQDTLAGSYGDLGVAVARKLNERTKTGRRLYFLGRVAPASPRTVVYLQRKTCGHCAWRVFAKQRTSSTGAWKFLIPTPRKGAWHWRAFTPAGQGFIKSWTGTYRSYRY